MKVNLHYPETGDGMITLQETVAELHAKAIINYIQALNCPDLIKADLLDYLKVKAEKMSKF